MAPNTTKPTGQASEAAFPFLPSGMRNFVPMGLPSMQARNAEAIMSAARIMLEGMQQVSARNAEMFGGALDRLAQEAQGMAHAEQPQDLLRIQAEIAKKNLDLTLKNIRELTDITNKCCFNAFDVLNRRCAEAIGEAGEQSAAVTEKAQPSGNGSGRRAPRD